MDQYEQFFDCPHCGQSISVLLDLSVPVQEYIGDCEACCRSIEVKYRVGEDGEIGFESGR